MCQPSFDQSPGPGAAERRGGVRHEDPFAPAVQYLVRPDFQCDWALLADRSAGGVGLMLGRCLAPGATLLVRLEGPRPCEPITRLARVVHVTRKGDGIWRVGCQFTMPLTGPDLAAVPA